LRLPVATRCNPGASGCSRMETRGPLL